ncbi:HEAT repeat domain-containing protein [Ralstonia pseudosolanacearum]
MSSKDDIDSARELFATYAQDFWTVLKERGHKPANKISDKSRVIVEHWDKRGELVALLYPLLSHKAEAVRFAAAGSLLERAESAEAIAVLQEVSKNPRGFMAIVARTLLEKRGIPVSTNGDIH